MLSGKSRDNSTMKQFDNSAHPELVEGDNETIPQGGNEFKCDDGLM